MHGPALVLDNPDEIVANLGDPLTTSAYFKVPADEQDDWNIENGYTITFFWQPFSTECDLSQNSGEVSVDVDGGVEWIFG